MSFHIAKHNLVVVAPFKTASTAIRRSFGLVYPTNFHPDAAWLRGNLGAAYDAAVKVGTARHPFDRAVAWYYDRQRKGQAPAGFHRDAFRRIVGPGSAFYLGAPLRLWRPDQVDYILNFETLRSQWPALLDLVGAPKATPLLRANVHPHPTADDVLDGDLRLWLRGVYADEFRFFGYPPRIDTPAD